MLRPIKTGTLTLLLLILLFGSIQAQDGQQTYINYVQVSETEDAAILSVFFNIVGPSQDILPGVRAESVELLLDDGNVYSGNVVQPEMPLYVALVLDASGSMSPANADMRAAAAQSVDNAPDLAQFAVFSFNETVQFVQDFSPDHNRTINNINTIGSVAQSGTCLYDAMYQAVDTLSNQPPGRRAMIVFTDGVDEDSNRNPCSTRALNEVISRANTPASRVPIYVVGMEGGSGNSSQINRGELTNIASSTGGLVALGSQADLSSMFSTIMEALRSQWLAQIALYPQAGNHTAIFTPILEGGIRNGDANISFSISRDFALPFELYVDGITYDEASDTIIAQLRSVGDSRVTMLVVDIVERQTNLTHLNTAFNGVPIRLEVSGGELERDVSYILRLTPFGANNRPLLEEPIEHEFTYRGPEVPIQIEPHVDITDITLSGDLLVASLSALGQEQITRLQISIIDDSTNLTVAGTDGTTSGVPSSIQVPIGMLERGRTYRLSVRAMDANNILLTDAPSEREFGLEAIMPIIRIEGVNHTPKTRNVSLDLTSSDSQMVNALRISIIDKETNVRAISPFAIEGVPRRIDLDTDELNGQMSYIVEIMPLDANDFPIYSQPLTIEFTYQPPGLTPVQRISGIVTNPIVLTLLVAVGVGIAFFMVGNVRQSRKQAATPVPNYIADQRTQVQGARVINPSSSSRKSSIRQGYEPTLIDDSRRSGGQGQIGMMTRPPQEKTVVEDQIDYATTPRYDLAVLKILRSNTHKVHKQFYIRQHEYTIGREKTHLNFENDPSVSRQHLRMTYSSKEQTFYVVDQNSSAGTKIDGEAISPGVPVRLRTNQPTRVEIGKSVTLEIVITNNTGE